ncbi:MAG TPA: hypothetical protein VFE46_20120 [Pirellulales bacterium]|nr:hypothetical protein [Pirellulales bacterium]
MSHRILFCAVFALMMIGFLCIPTPASAVQFGWQSLPEGGIEYLVQVEPDLLDSFRQQGFTSDIPPGLQGQLRRIHISIGDAKLPNQGDVVGPKNSGAASVNPSREKTFPPTTQPPIESAPPASDRLNLPPPPGMDEPKAKSSSPTAESAPAELPKSLSSPFFHSGPIKKLEPDSLPATAGGGTVTTAAQTAPVSPPRWPANESSVSGSQTFASNQIAVDADKPAVSDAGWTPATSKPWLALMATLLALFASLGANAYLVWIHQDVRAKYRALVQRMGANGTATS